MKRRHVHVVYLAVAVSSLCYMTLQAWHIRQAEQINASVESFSDATSPGAVLDALDESEDVRIQLRRASALSQADDDAEAERLFVNLAREATADDVRLAAQFNLANHYLRQALSSTVEANAVMPLVELAKQRYRDVLKQAPDHWNARYNLEQALRLAPEGVGQRSAEDGEPIKRVDVIVPDFERGDLP